VKSSAYQRACTTIFTSSSKHSRHNQSPEWKNSEAAAGKNPALPPAEEVIDALVKAFSPSTNY
jgi:hypothetical protein